MATGQSTAFWLNSAVHGAAINKARRASITITVVKAEDPGLADQALSPAAIAVGKVRVDVQLFGTDPSDIRALPAAAAANLVLGYVGDSAINETHTLKNVKFHTFLGQIDLPDPDAPGGTISVWGVAGTCQAGAADTLAELWATAAA